MELQEIIAKAGKPSLLWEDHGILTVNITLEYGGGSCQGIGGYCLDSYNKTLKEREGTAFGLEFLMRTMQAFGVQEWDKIQGKMVYALKESEFGNSLVRGLRPLPFEGGREFLFDELAQKYKEKEAA